MRDYRKIVGFNVKTLRENRGLSQEELGFLAGIDRTYVSGVERGLRNPTVLVLVRFAVALNVTPSLLLTDNIENSDSHN
ncbi:helix-turn-helix transcriptional regulator [Brucella sp. NBRC 12951]|uniref:helix-turn-helix domain-containing protein n=1 Tax=Brucella sp. NBRC 12951 TaxID=3075479 RepID=UPI00333F548F